MLPELSFTDADIDTLLEDSIKIVEKILGRKLERADPLTLFLKSLLSIIVNQKILIDYTAKLNLLAYSEGDALDHIGALVGVYRLPAANATCTCKVTLSAELDKTVTIVKGTRVTPGNEIFFALDDDLIFLSGDTELEGKFECLTAGKIGNNFAVGDINKIVDPQPYLLSIENITVSDGGADIEDDDSLRDRIRIAPESFSTAGPTGAYEFFVKEASSLITDVSVTSDNPGEVDIYFLQSNSDIPTTEVINLVYDVLNDRKIRPLTDNVIIKLPEVVDFDIELTYFISRNDQAYASTIQQKVNSAVDDFIIWQKSKLGRDLNDSRLIEVIRQAGAKRVELISPKFQVISQNQIAVCKNISVNFGGFENI